MPHCAIINCTNSTKLVNRVSGDVSFHCFPNDPKLKEKWIEATGNKNWFPTKHSRICSVHFTKDNFSGANKPRRLCKTAYPTINVLQRINIEENKGLQSSSKQALRNISEKKNIEKDVNQPTTSISNEDTPSNSPKGTELLNKLSYAKKQIKLKDVTIKRLREKNRRKGNKILALKALIECLKKKV